MKRYCLSLLAAIVALALLLQTGCQEQAKAPDESPVALVEAEPETAEEVVETAAPPREGAPKITFEKVAHDFGEVGAGKKYTGEFKFTNTGDGLLKITDVKKCCGTVVRLAKREYAPGQSGVLKVDYSSPRAASTMRRKLYVSSNDKANPKVELTISAKIVPKVAYEPKRLKLEFRKENAGCPNITLTSMDKQPFSIKAFTSTGASITADVDPSVEATEFVLEPKVDLEKLKSRSVGFISIALTHPECKKVTVSFNTLQRFAFKPRSIIVFNPKPEKPLVRKLSVASNYDEEFEIASTSSKNGFAKVLGQEETAQGYQLDVEITPPPADGTGKFMDMLYVNLEGGEKLSITCYGRYLKPRPPSRKKVETSETESPDK
jgi:hypothetical protein